MYVELHQNVERVTSCMKALISCRNSFWYDNSIILILFNGFLSGMDFYLGHLFVFGQLGSKKWSYKVHFKHAAFKVIPNPRGIGRASKRNVKLLGRMPKLSAGKCEMRRTSVRLTKCFPLPPPPPFPVYPIPSLTPLIRNQMYFRRPYPQALCL